LQQGGNFCKVLSGWVAECDPLMLYCVLIVAKVERLDVKLIESNKFILEKASILNGNL
jgi:hypothetical protein